MRMIDAERLREELLWRNVFLTDNEIDALVDLIDDQPTIFPLNEPLTLDELRAMVGNPVYDCLGQIWYIVESYYDHDLIMTDGTHFNDENKYARVSKRFYCRPTIPAPQWISVEDRLPHNADEVLIYFSDGIVISGDYFDAVGFIPEHFYDGNGGISHWMPKLEPSDKRYKCRYADDNGVCSKLSGNGEIIYCIEGPCPYDMPEEVRNE